MLKKLTKFITIWVTFPRSSKIKMTREQSKCCPWFLICKELIHRLRSDRSLKIGTRLNLATNTFLKKIGKTDSSACSFCGVTDESLEHLFVTCQFHYNAVGETDNLVQQFKYQGRIIICYRYSIWWLAEEGWHICYLPAGRSVQGKTVPAVLSTAQAAGQGPYSRPRAQFFPIQTDLGW